MKIILHLGMPKTGSSALQSALSLNRALLLKEGILYPKLSCHPTNHNILSLLERKGDDIPRQFISWNKIQGVDLDKVLNKSINEIKLQVARHSPEILIISSEQLFSAFSKPAGEFLACFFSSLGVSADKVFPVVYVRQPSKRFLSMTQQKLRASTSIPSLKTQSVVSNLRCVEKVFTKATVVAFERNALFGNDIFIDFAQRILLFQDIKKFNLLSHSVNESLSAEVVSILYDYSMHCLPDANDLFTFDRRYIWSRLPALEKQLGLYSRPVLHSEIEWAIDYSDKDLLFLRNEYGVEFKELDYARVGEAPELSGDTHLRIDQIFQIDKLKKTKLLILLLGEMVETKIKLSRYFWRLYNFPAVRYIVNRLYFL